jgi:hypothetical protein
MDDESKVTEAECWTDPPESTPIADIERLRDLVREHGVPIDHPEAFPNVAELLDSHGRRTGIIVRVDDPDTDGED